MDTFETVRSARGLKITEACDLIGISRSLYYSIKDRGQAVSEKAMDRVLTALQSKETGPQPDLPSKPSALYSEIAPSLSPRLAESGGTLSKAEVRVLVGEIKVRLEMIQLAFENLHDE